MDDWVVTPRLWRRWSEPPVPQGDRGVTLIELLVVVAMLAILAVGVSLPLRGGPDQVTSDVLRFQSVFARSRALAVHGRVPRGLAVTSTGLRLMQPATTGWHTSDHTIRWQGRGLFTATGPGAATRGTGTPDITFLPNGQTSSFELRLTGRGARSTLCLSDGWTGVTCREI